MEKTFVLNDKTYTYYTDDFNFEFLYNLEKKGVKMDDLKKGNGSFEFTYAFISIITKLTMNETRKEVAEDNKKYSFSNFMERVTPLIEDFQNCDFFKDQVEK